MLSAADAKPQPNGWSCGPMALHHALLCYGQKSNVRRLAAQSQTPCCGGAETDGRCEHGLAKAARLYGYRLDRAIAHSPSDAYKFVREQIRDRTPILVCVDHYAHWVAIVRATTRHAWIADSSRDQDEHLQRWTWRALFRRVAYGLPDEVRFDFFPLTYVGGVVAAA